MLGAAKESGKAPPIERLCAQQPATASLRGLAGVALGPETLTSTCCCPTPLCITPDFALWLPQLSFAFLFL